MKVEMWWVRVGGGDMMGGGGGDVVGEWVGGVCGGGGNDGRRSWSVKDCSVKSGH